MESVSLNTYCKVASLLTFSYFVLGHFNSEEVLMNAILQKRGKQGEEEKKSTILSSKDCKMNIRLIKMIMDFLECIQMDMGQIFHIVL